MADFAMTCTCGHTMTVAAETRDEAVNKLKALMDESAVAAHMAERHPGQPGISMSDVHAMIEQTVRAA